MPTKKLLVIPAVIVYSYLGILFFDNKLSTDSSSYHVQNGCIRVPNINDKTESTPEPSDSPDALIKPNDEGKLLTDEKPASLDPMWTYRNTSFLSGYPKSISNQRLS